jgi:hypothetical protein
MRPSVGAAVPFARSSAESRIASVCWCGCLAYLLSLVSLARMQARPRPGDAAAAPPALL